MVARVTHPDLAGAFPQLKNPQDASYFAIAMATMPSGMVGLLLSGIFAATMSSMDSGLNRNAGFFIKNFYEVVARPRASERELMVASLLTTLVMGAMVIAAGLWFASLSHLPIFDLVARYGDDWPVVGRLVVAGGLTAAFTWLSWRVIERPFLRRKEKLEAPGVESTGPSLDHPVARQPVGP